MRRLSGLSQRWEPGGWRLAAWPPASPGRALRGGRLGLGAPRSARPHLGWQRKSGRGSRLYDFCFTSACLFFFFVLLSLSLFFFSRSGSDVHAGLSGSYLKSPAANEPMTALWAEAVVAIPHRTSPSSRFLNSGKSLSPPPVVGARSSRRLLQAF